MKLENKEIFIPGPSGRIQAKYYKNKQQGTPVALVLHPHPQYGGTMNNRVVYETYNCFYKNQSTFVNSKIGRITTVFNEERILIPSKCLNMLLDF